MTRATQAPGMAVAALLLLLCLEACSGEKVGTQTNWLLGCQSNSDCGTLSCLCGACTQSCEDDAGCSELVGSACVPNDDAGVIALCGGTSPTGPGMCLPRCPAEGCEAGTSCVAGVCTPVLEPSAHVSVDDSQRFQTLIGIGAGIGYVNDEIVLHPRREALFDAMFSDTGLSMLRLRNGDNQASTETIVSAATSRLGRPPVLILNSASAPASLKQNGSTWCEGNPDTCTLVKLPDGSFDYAGLANYWRTSLDTYALVGIEPDYISIQNNPNWVPAAGASYEACKFLPTEGALDVTTSAGTISVDYPGYAEALDAVLAGLEGLASIPRIVAPETTHFELVSAYTDALDFSQVDAIAHHMYGADPAALDTAMLESLADLGAEQQRPVFQSEMQADAESTALLMHGSFVFEDAAVFVQNGFVGSAFSIEPTDTVLINLTADDFVLGDPYHAMLHYSAHIEPGWVRVAANSDSSDVLASAWVSPEADRLVVVLTNPGITDQVVELDTGAGAAAASTVIRSVWHGLERSQELGALAASGTLTLPGQSMISVTLER